MNFVEIFMGKALKHLASTQTGLTFRSRLEPEEGGDVGVVQMSDLSDSPRLTAFRNLPRINHSGLHQRHFLKRGDLVFRSRGKNTTATLIDVEIEKTVLAAPLIKIRVKDERALFPGYLSWFINQPSSQAFLHSRATGSAMVMIGKSVLDALEVPVLSLTKQKEIAAFAELSGKEQMLMGKLANARKTFAQQILDAISSRI